MGSAAIYRPKTFLISPIFSCTRPSRPALSLQLRVPKHLAGFLPYLSQKFFGSSLNLVLAS
jgi:hypothetical protein